MAAPSADTTLAPLPLVYAPDNRGFTGREDARIVNAYAEKFQDGVRVCKRPGFSLLTTPPASGSGLGNGVWRRAFDLFELRGGRVYVDAVDYGPYDTSLDVVYWFNGTLGAPNYTYFSNGVSAYTWAAPAGPLAQIVDPDYPAVTVPGSAFLDGTLYVMDRGARIFGSDINNPNSWQATNVIQAQITPDRGMAIAKSLIYVVAFKEYSTEFFYDAANPTGSPLKPVPNGKLAYGCRFEFSVQEIDDMLFWVATTREGGFLVGRIAGVKFSRISTPSIDRLLSQTGQIRSSYSARVNGHTYYFLNLTTGVTLAYDVYEEFWNIWDGLDEIQAASGFNVTATNPNNVFQLRTGELVVAAELTFRDTDDLYGTGDTPIPVDVITPNFDGGTRLGKVLSKLRLVADQKSAGTLQVRWSDDDYKTWSGWQSVDLTNPTPFLTNLGKFQKRAFWFHHNSNSQIRLESAELEIMVGSI